MKTSMLPKTFAVLLLSSLMFVTVHPPTFATSETDDLKTQIQALNDRIDVLEKQLIQKDASAQALPYAHPSVSQNYSWDPFRDMRLMQQRMNQLFDDSFERGFGATPSGFLSPQTDIKAEEDRYVVTLDLPGMDKDTIDVEIKNGSLVVSGKRSLEKENKGDRFYSQQRSFGQFMKTLSLPADAKSDQIQARYDKGVLEVIIEREKNARTGSQGSKKIKVN